MNKKENIQSGIEQIIRETTEENQSKQKLDELQERQKVLYEQQGNTLAVAYWLNQFQDTTDRKDEAAAEPTVVKTLVEKMIVNNETMTVDIHFKCGVVIRGVL